MQGRFRRTQHLLNALPVLEASVRLGSFTKAGEHLGLSQPAVSRHIANLEDQLSVKLFARNHNKLTVTRQGRDLANAVDLGLSHIDAAIRKTAGTAGAGGLRLACTQSFANCWLLPRFSSLRQAMGDVQVHLAVSHWLDDIDPDSVDMIAHWRPQGWAGWPRRQLFEEVTFPVCSQEYLDRNPALQNASEDPSVLIRPDLLHYEERAMEFAGWPEWFAASGIGYTALDQVFRYPSYQFMLQAAADGAGVALAWQHLAADKVASGELVQIGRDLHRNGAGYFLEYRDTGSTARFQQRLLDWFVAEAGR
ncbi:LysR substrate-binding domain-containing protein [Phaeobacter porticola]|uniref:Transcriptional regulator n=1 Tax=Phaeobacter porticola TaxID=1844006 RepID=A0A1L3I0L3_9RHOB|nr:LysR substrate-binding domain-containing protein [Phaeobacter porticola]APG45487.1 Transcriptional regulator [Phaeobacter porticola]